MIVQLTIKLKPYDSIKLTSNEYPTIEECMKELIQTVKYLDNSYAKQYMMNYFPKVLDDLRKELEPKI